MSFPTRPPRCLPLVLTIGFALASWLFEAKAELRQWADAHGTARLTAEFVRFDGADIVLRSETGRIIQVPESGLRASDRNFLRLLREQERNSRFTHEAERNAGFAIERAFSREVKARYELEVHYPTLEAKEWIWFAGKPPETDGQSLQSNLFPDSTTVMDESGSGRALWRARAPADPVRPGAGSARFVVGGKLFSRHLVKSDSPGSSLSPLTAAERKQFTAATEVFELSSEPFQAWLRESGLVRETGEESQIDFARRVFLRIAKDFEYLYRKDLDRSFGFVCREKRSDCGGLSTLFVSTLRANDIPARTLAGRWAQSAVPGETLGGVSYSQYHVKAEFWADGVGWIPVDMAAAVDKPGPDEQLLHFGRDKGDFITMHFDYGLDVDTVYFGRKTVRCLQGLCFWVTGKGKLAGRERKENWIVEER